MRFHTLIAHNTRIVVLASMTTLGCMSAPARVTSNLATQRNVILLAEIQSAPHRLVTARDVVRMLRPEMLNSRDPALARWTEVYVDDVPNGGFEALASIPAEVVVRLQRLTSIEAASRYGGSHPGGIIAVTTNTRAARP